MNTIKNRWSWTLADTGTATIPYILFASSITMFGLFGFFGAGVLVAAFVGLIARRILLTVVTGIIFATTAFLGWKYFNWSGNDVLLCSICIIATYVFARLDLHHS